MRSEILKFYLLHKLWILNPRGHGFGVWCEWRIVIKVSSITAKLPAASSRVRRSPVPSNQTCERGLTIIRNGEYDALKSSLLVLVSIDIYRQELV